MKIKDLSKDQLIRLVSILAKKNQALTKSKTRKITRNTQAPRVLQSAKPSSN